MGRLRLYATSVERKAAWRRRHGMAVRPQVPPPRRPSKPPLGRGNGQVAQALAARECATIQQALPTRALADQCWELHACSDDWSRDADMPHHVSEGRSSGPVAGASTSFYGVATARGRGHRRALQRLAQVRATRAVHADAPHAAGPPAPARTGHGRARRVGSPYRLWGILSKMARPALQHAIGPHNIGTPRRHFLKTCSRAPVRVV